MVDSDMGRLWWRRAPHSAAAGGPAWRGPAAYGALTVAMTAGFLHYIPGPPPGPTAAVRASSDSATTTASFRRIILPDLAVIDPKGIDAASLARIGRAHGIRQVLALDGAALTSGGHRVNVIGVDAQFYRSWTPLGTASNQRLWSALQGGGFIASTSVRHRLRLRTGSSYSLAGAATVRLPFAGAAPLGIKGIDMVVAARVSAKLGLIHHVAALISAPGLTIAKLRREVRAVVGRHATLVTLREQQVLPNSSAAAPASAVTTKRPTTYIQLFQESAAKYCPGLPWTVLAAIGQIESNDGADVGPSTAGALGPMQFEPATWRVWGITAFGEPGPPNIMDPYDAVPSAAQYLCAAGGATAAGLPKAIFAYNHANWYVAEVLALAKAYASQYG
jgi:Transglycosylase SLT domain